MRPAVTGRECSISTGIFLCPLNALELFFRRDYSKDGAEEKVKEITQELPHEAFKFYLFFFKQYYLTFFRQFLSFP